VDSLAKALGHLLSDTALRERLGVEAAERAHREFTVEAMVNAYESVYRKALARDSK